MFAGADFKTGPAADEAGSKLTCRIRFLYGITSETETLGCHMGGRLWRVQAWEQVAKAAGFQPADMAALCGISSRQLQRFFLERFQTTPRQWLRAFQCRAARQLIGQGYSNAAVAAELGFASESHFCREFK